MIDVDKGELNKKMDDLETELDEFDINSILRERLLALLRKAKFSTGSDEEILTSYEKALGISLQGYGVIHKRDVDEININNYNPEWIHSWNGNMDIQLCLDFYAIITYISDYYAKDYSGTMEHIKEALQKAENDGLRNRLSIVANQFLTHRQIGESEAYYRLLPHLHLKESNVETVSIQTGFKQNRSRIQYHISSIWQKVYGHKIRTKG